MWLIPKQLFFSGQLFLSFFKELKASLIILARGEKGCGQFGEIHISLAFILAFLKETNNNNNKESPHGCHIVHVPRKDKTHSMPTLIEKIHFLKLAILPKRRARLMCVNLDGKIRVILCDTGVQKGAYIPKWPTWTKKFLELWSDMAVVRQPFQPPCKSRMGLEAEPEGGETLEAEPEKGRQTWQHYFRLKCQGWDFPIR